MSSVNLQVAFVCPNCHRDYGDPLYHGPSGHAPQNLCMDCWAEEWALVELRMLNGGNWGVLDSALWLVCCGFSRQQAAKLLGLHRNTIGNWLTRLKKHRRSVPEWMAQKAAQAGCR